MEEQTEEQARKCQPGCGCYPNELGIFISFLPLRTEMLLYLLPFVAASDFHGGFVGPAGILPGDLLLKRLSRTYLGLMVHTPPFFFIAVFTVDLME